MCKRLIFFGFFALVSTLILPNITEGADPSLLGWWKLDDGEGTVVLDSSGRDNHGTINNPEGGMGVDNSVWDTDPERGMVLGFSGDDSSGSYVSAGTIPPMTTDNEFTWVFWARQDADQGNNDDVILGNRWNASTWIKFTPSIFEFGGSSPDFAINYDNLPPDTWVHHAVVKDGTHYTYYRDGVISQEADINNTCEALPLLMGGDTDGERWRGRLSDVRIYSRALSEVEIQAVIRAEPALSSVPNPPNGAIDVPRDDVILSWVPGQYADGHDVYIGTLFEDVNRADTTNPLDVLAVQGHDANTFYLDRLEFGRTYYWRVDEVNAPPESTVYRGDIWNFTTELLAYPIPGHRITATASSRAGDQGPEKTIDGSGVGMNGLHSNSASAMWLSDASEPGLTWVRYEFDRAYKLHEMRVWNYNGQLFLPGFGFKDVTVEYSDNGNNWTQLRDVVEFAMASGQNDYAANTSVDFGDMKVRSVRITAHSNWGGGSFNKFGLSEVYFLQIPVYAGQPRPEAGAADVALDVTLGWKAGREAAEHNVYLNTDRQAVIDGTVPAVTVSETSYSPLFLDLGSVYYWRIDEANNAETPQTWQSDIWSFSTQEYLVVDDFESYNDIPEGQEGSNLVYLTWFDGYSDPLKGGSVMGYFTGTSMETENVYGGYQAGPLFYDNTSAGYSEIMADTSDLPVGRDWSKGSPEVLVLWVHGDPGNNPATEQMYVKVNNAMGVFDGDLALADWQEFSVDLASLDVNLNNVTTVTIGFKKTGATGGSGMVLIDDILLYTPLVEQ